MAGPADLGATGGVVWSDPEEWAWRRKAEGCVICRDGASLDILSETSSCWVTAAPEGALPAYVCVVARAHVVEPYELPPSEQAVFWQDAMTAARAVAEVARPVKMNYEIHGNTLPHLHLHLFPRQVDDPYVGGPIDPRRASFRRSDSELAALQKAIAAAFAAAGR